MDLSPNGEALVKGFESYLKPLNDGTDRCISYLCPAGKWTLGWGCTEGVKPGMIWTRAEAEAAFRREMAKHVAAVRRLVTVDLNQNQFDALVSFSYNVGADALGGSTLLTRLNRGDYSGAQAEFLRWNKATDPKSGKKVIMRGLSIRRAAEAELFARRTTEENDDKGALVMPQVVEAPVEPWSATTKTIAAGTAGTTISVGAQVAANSLAPAAVPAPPPVIVDTVTNLTAWQSAGKAAIALSTAAWSQPSLLLVCGGLAIAGIWLPVMLRGRK